MHYAAWNQQGNVMEMHLSVAQAEELASIWHKGARPEYFKPATKNELKQREARREWRRATRKILAELLEHKTT